MLLRNFVSKFDSSITLNVFNAVGESVFLGAIAGFNPHCDSVGSLKVRHVIIVPNEDGSQITLEIWT